MTAAERALLNVVLETESAAIGCPKNGPLADAVRAVLAERSTPEAKEKFLFLHTKMVAAQREFSAFAATLPSPLVHEWYPRDAR